jgi:hypothetical protein
MTSLTGGQPATADVVFLLLQRRIVPGVANTGIK